ncbi:MAG: ParB/RepB/Spo0J family partition protein [Pyrinomonadaceae bacterium]
MKDGQLLSISINSIKPSSTNPRKRFDEAKLRELASSIKTSGVIQPLTVRAVGNRYEVIAGERRLRASQIAGLVEIPCIVRDAKPSEVLEWQIIENAQREDVSPLEEAAALKRMRDELDYTINEVCARIGKSDAHVYNRLVLLDLPETAQKALNEGLLSTGVAVRIARLPTMEQRKQATEDLIKPEWSARITSEPAAKQYIEQKFGEKGKKYISRGTSPQALQAKGLSKVDYVGNWKQYLVKFTAEQFLAWQRVVKGRIDTAILAEGVDVVMREAQRARA